MAVMQNIPDSRAVSRDIGDRSCTAFDDLGHGAAVKAAGTVRPNTGHSQLLKTARIRISDQDVAATIICNQGKS
jgi:hypothetical protein